MDGAVGKIAYEVEVANDRPGLWTGWQVKLAATEMVGEEEEEG